MTISRATRLTRPKQRNLLKLEQLEPRQLLAANVALNDVEVPHSQSFLTNRVIATAETSGDLNSDGVTDANDIDLIYAEIQVPTGDAIFDLTGDTLVNQDDVDQLVLNMIGTHYGDADLDGDVDIADFVVLAANFGRADASSWSEGNFDGTGGVAFRDAVILFNNYQSPPDSSIRISEIMYHPGPMNTGGEFVELFNNGTETVSLAGWELQDGINFEFPEDTSLAPGAYLVVYGEATAPDFYQFTNGIGPFARRLSNAGERIGLVNANGDTIVKVDYLDQASWATEADGFGPSLELIDPDGDNNDPNNWGVGQLYTPGFSNVPDINQGGSDIAITEIMYRPEISRRTKPIDPFANQPYWSTGSDLMGEYVELFNLGTEIVDLSGWRLFDERELLYEFAAGTSLNPGEYIVVAADADAIGERYGITNVVGNFPQGRMLADGGERLVVTSINDRVMDAVNFGDESPWPIGPDELSTSLELLDPKSDNANPANWRSSRVPQSVKPDNPKVGDEVFLSRGTPGGPNSISSDGLPPFAARHEIQHIPLRPTSADVVTIATGVTSGDTVTSVTLDYNVFVAPYETASQTMSIPMHDDGLNGDAVANDGRYSAQIAALDSQTLVRYRITATDTSDRSWSYPDAAEPNPNKAYFVYDGEGDTSLNAYFLIVPSASQQHLNRYISSREYQEATVIIDGIVYDHIGIHLRGRGWRTHPKKSFKLAFNKTELFRGMSRLDLAMHFPTMQNAVHNIFYSTGARALRSEPIRLYRNGEFFGLMLSQESPNTSWLRASDLDPNGDIYKASSAPDYRQDGFSGDIMADLDHFDDPSVYPQIWEKKGNALGSYDSIIELTDIIANTPDEELYQKLDETIELDKWLYTWAVNVAAGNGDIVGTNYFVIKPAEEGAKWQTRAFDYSHFFGCQMLDFVDGICNPHTQDPYLYFNHFHFRVMENTQLKNRFLVILKDVLENAMHPNEVSRRISHTFSDTELDRLDEVALNIPGPPKHYVVYANDQDEMKEYYRNRHGWLLNTWIPEQGITLPENNHPTIELQEPEVSELGTLIKWNHSDPEGDAATVDLSWTDGKWTYFAPITEQIPAENGSFLWTNPPGVVNSDIFVHAVIRDAVSDLVGRDTSHKPGPPDPPVFNTDVEKLPLPFELIISNPNKNGEVFYTLDGRDPRGGNNAPTPSAIVYTEPVTLLDNTKISSRVRATNPIDSSFQWSDLVQESLLIPSPPDPPLLNTDVEPLPDPFELIITNPNETGEVLFTLNGTDPRAGNNEPSAAAVMYTKPVAINGVVVVQARARTLRPTGDRYLWSDPVEELLVVSLPKLAITEIMYNPTGGSRFEFIELFNPTNEPINLGGIAVGGRGTLVEFPSDGENVLGPGEYTVLVKDLEDFSSRYDMTSIHIGGTFARSLSNTTQRVNLNQPPLPNPFVEIQYRDKWHPTTDGDGFSLVLVDPLSSPDSWKSPEAWRPSREINGSPGGADN